MSSNSEIATLTKTYIKTAMLELLSKQSYDKISITELVERAGVSRTAFYRNYTSRDELIDDLVKDILNSTSLDAKEIIEYNINDLENFYRDLRSKKKEIEILTKASLENIHILNRKKEIAVEILKRNSLKGYKDAATEGALNSIISKWILDGMVLSDKEIASITYKIFHEKE